MELDSTMSMSAGSSSGSSSSAATKLDNHLAGTGYLIRSSDLSHVAQRLEHLENVIDNSPSSFDISDAILYNPSDIASVVDSLLSELTHPVITSPSTAAADDEQRGQMFQYPCQNQHVVGGPTLEIQYQDQMLMMMEEDSGIRLVHMLMSCAQAVDQAQLSLAFTLVEDMQRLILHVNTLRGIGKVAGYFIEALNRRILSPHGIPCTSPYENEILYQNFYEACPYLKFAHFTANQAILEAFDGHDCVHVVDFNLMHGLQWPPLIQALALRPGGPPSLRITGIGPPSLDGRDSLREIGVRLASLANSVNVRFAFRGVAAARLEDVKPWMLQVSSKEALAINSIMQFHKLLGTSDPNSGNSTIGHVLGWIRSLNPKIVAVVEQEANHNKPGFLDRFTEALYYYSTMFDSIESCPVQPEKVLAEMHLQREICNVLCCEGAARVERHEPLAKWRARMGETGFREVHLGSNAYKQASMLLSLFSADGYCVEENDGCLTLGWHSRPLIAASAWQADGIII